ncbi:MAG: type I 3-dehydroquinate dehydratase [Clostridia bacterium]|nr:type I 3-dehydroquinate dehydratase [Clostridia bacterium]
MKKFTSFGKPPLTVMIQTDDAADALATIRRAIPLGADAFGIQTCCFKPEDRNADTYKRLFDAMEGRPAYVTAYRHRTLAGKSEEEIAGEILGLAKCGAALCDVMSDLFDPQPDEVAKSAEAAARQRALIDAVHDAGAEVLLSAHVKKFTPAPRVLEIARFQESQGADIAKIVTGAADQTEELENLRITRLLKEELSIPFLYLSAGESRLLRRIGPMLGSCMFLCVEHYGPLSTKSQPLLTDLAEIRDRFGYFA